MIKIVKGDQTADLARILSRGKIRYDKEEASVKSILARVEKEGDKALFDLTRRFDNYPLSSKNILIKPSEVRAAAKLCPKPLRSAMDQAIANIRAYHRKQSAPDFSFSPSNGVTLAQRTLPIESVAVYIPGGSFPLFSTALMTIIPAQIAGVSRIIAATPPRREGLDPAMAYAFTKLGLSEIYRIGGAQAVAAFAFGTRSVPRVDKLVGPGNLYVSLAKKLLYGLIDIDMIAGPSEILVIADHSANPAFIARDLLSQSEHGSGSESSILLTTDPKLAQAVREEIISLIRLESPQSPIRRALERYGLIIVLSSLDECARLANRIAPEHLEIITRNPRALLNRIRHAGAVFLGPHTCESVGDYFAGPSHVLPTNGTARFFSPLSTYHFLKRMSVLEYSSQAVKKAANSIITMAEKEGLYFHADSVRIRK